MDKRIEFAQVVDRCCVLDVHKKVIVATVEGTGITRQTREFESTTKYLTELKEWLLELGVTHVAMESTGVYWKPVMAWICKLLRARLLKRSFIPDRA